MVGISFPHVAPFSYLFPLSLLVSVLGVTGMDGIQSWGCLHAPSFGLYIFPFSFFVSPLTLLLLVLF